MRGKDSLQKAAYRPTNCNSVSGTHWNKEERSNKVEGKAGHQRSSSDLHTCALTCLYTDMYTNKTGILKIVPLNS